MRRVTPISRFIRGPDWRLDLGGLSDPAVAVPLVGFVSQMGQNPLRNEEPLPTL